MKSILLLFVFVISSISVNAQEHVNLKKGYAAEGYDVVSYFQNKAQEGDKKYVGEHDGIKYKFSSAENLATFSNNPEKFIPQYGGFCAYAVAKNGKKVGVDPKTFVITDGKLYLFYNSWGVNTLEKWNEEDPSSLQQKADKKWDVILDN